jgi:hypothetical protein
MTYVLLHDTENLTESFVDLKSAQRSFYRKWRLDDGSIPWRMFYGEYQLDPATGFITKTA